MKKYIISLLIMVIILTMTACTNSDAEQAVTTPVESTIADITYETFPEPETEPELEPEIKIEYLTKSQIQEMGPEELSAFYEEMISVSGTKTLSINDMDIIANNFYNIWHRNSAFDSEEFNLQCYNVFCNVYDQAVNARIPLENISSWSSIPAPEMLCKYFSSSNFEIPENAGFYAIDFLDDEEVSRVAEAFFANPVMATNTHIPSLIIIRDCNKATTDMAWKHFEELSNCTSPKTTQSSASFTSQVCYSLFTTTLNSDNIRKVAEIAEIMLENPYYDIQTKYMHFCNAFYHFDKNEYTDATIAYKAIDSLFIRAQNADEYTVEQLKGLVDVLNPSIAGNLSRVLEENYPSE